MEDGIFIQIISAWVSVAICLWHSFFHFHQSVALIIFSQIPSFCWLTSFQHYISAPLLSFLFSCNFVQLQTIFPVPLPLPLLVYTSKSPALLATSLFSFVNQALSSVSAPCQSHRSARNNDAWTQSVHVNGSANQMNLWACRHFLCTDHKYMLVLFSRNLQQGCTHVRVIASYVI